MLKQNIYTDMEVISLIPPYDTAYENRKNENVLINKNIRSL